MDDESNRSILIVDDERRFTAALAKRLELRGFSCCMAFDGLSALAFLEKRPFAAVLLDLRLPDIHGMQVLSRALAARPDLSVIIMTAHGDERDRRVCLRLGARAFLRKPVALAELLALLEGDAGGGG